MPPPNPYAKGYLSSSKDRRNRGSSREIANMETTTQASSEDYSANSIKLDSVKLLLSDILPLANVESENLFNFLSSVIHVSDLSLIPFDSLMIYLTSKLPVNFRMFWFAAIQRKLSFQMLVSEIWQEFVSSREYERLIAAKVKRYQMPSEPPLEFLNVVTVSAKVLGLSLSDVELVSIVLDGVNPLTRSTFVFRSKPTNILELKQLLSYASKQLMDFANYSATFNPNSPRAITCTFCNRQGHTFGNCRQRRRNSNSNRPAITMFHATDSLSPALPIVKVTIGNHSLEALIDSGSTYSLIDVNSCNNLQLRSVKTLQSPIQIRGLGGTTFTLTQQIKVKVKVSSFSWSHYFYLVDLPFPVLIGRDFMLKTRMILGHNYFTFQSDPTQIIPFIDRQLENSSRDTAHPVLSSSSSVKRVSPALSTNLGSNKLVNSCSPSDNSDIPQDVVQLINEFPDVITTKLGSTGVMAYEIQLTDTTPVRSHPFSLPPAKAKILQDSVSSLIQQGVVEASTSQWASPAFLIPKRDKGWRLVVDYRKLNGKVQVDPYPTPSVEHAFQYLSEAKVFSILDLNSAFNQIPLSESSKKYTAFVTPFGLFQYTRLPFGFVNSPQVFTRLMDLVLGDLKYNCVYPYIDDLCIFSKDISSHLVHLRAVLQKLRDAGLTLHPGKMKLCQNSISFLGHVLRGGCLHIDPERVRPIQNVPVPLNLQQVSRFLGMAGFYSKFIPGYAEIAHPLNQLKKKDARFVWSTVHNDAFNKLKNALANPPVLSMPCFTRDFHLFVDASNVALGAVLNHHIDGKYCPVAYASRTLNPHEQKLTAYELECMACIWGIEKFKDYLQFRPFHLYTDNGALTWLFNHPKQLGKIARMVLKLSSYKFTIHHIKANLNKPADCLSRIQVQESATSCFLHKLPMSFVDIRTHQNNDPYCVPLINKLTNDGLKLVKENGISFALKNNLLCSKVSKAKNFRVVVPVVIRPMLFQYFHSLPSSGHLGIFKTVQKISQSYWWPNFKTEITEMVKRCSVCQITKPRNVLSSGVLSSQPISNPWERIFIDFVGPLPRSKSGNCYIFTVIDGFSKFVFLESVRDASSKSAIHVLFHNLFPKFGYPKYIVSDNATAFTSSAFKDACFKVGIKIVHTAPYYPCPNLVERVHRNLRFALSAYCTPSHKIWDEFLGDLTFAFNTSVHESTLYSPAKLFLGRLIPHPLDNVWDLPNCVVDTSCSDRDLRQHWTKAVQNLNKAHKRYAASYNKLHSVPQFKIGDLVLTQNHSVSSKLKKRMSKLEPLWSGPFSILRFVTPVTVVLQVGPNKEKISHVSQLKAYH